jgi:hypothetical protein
MGEHRLGLGEGGLGVGERGFDVPVHNFGFAFVLVSILLRLHSIG